MRVKKAPYTKWLRKKLEHIRIEDKINKACEVSQEHYPAHSWTALKLICFMWWVTIYTEIIPKHKNSFAYIDLLAGSGTNLITETNDIVLGSSLIAPLLSYKPFTQYLFFEKKEERAGALKKRLNAFAVQNWQVYPEDCNLVLDDSLLNFQHFLAFVDCEGLDVSWDTILKLLKRKGDILFIFMTEGINRVLGKAKRGYEMDSLTKFFGEDPRKDCNSVQDLLEEYMKKLREFRNYIEQIKIKGKYSYDIILACKYGPYVKAWEDLKNRMSLLKDKDAELALKICKGEIKTLEEFFEKGNTQSSLDTY